MIGFSQSVRIALGSIRSSKMRSALTTLGIIIGVAAVIANVSLGASFNQFFTDEVGTLGSNFIVIFSNDIDVFDDNQLELIRNTPGIVAVSPINIQLAEVKYLSTTRQVEILGVMEEYEEIGNVTMESGSYLSDNDRFVAVLGNDVAYDKFDRKVSTRNSIDITFRRRDGGVVTQKFKVKGIIQSPNTTFIETPVQPDERILIPIDTMNDLLGVSDFGGFNAKATTLESLDEVTDEVDERLARNLGVPTRDLDNEDAKPYVIFDQTDILELTNQLSSALTSLLTSIALISLIVGSIGIMNIMLVTVAERTNEIGLMKSLGYTYSDILTLFIVESMVVGLLGGVLGTILGLVGSYAVESYLGLPKVFPTGLIFVGFLVSVLVGLVAGIYPANKAAKMDPVEALRQ